MTREELKKWTLSVYNENTKYQLDYHINTAKCSIGDAAYLYKHEDDTLQKMKIIHIIRRSDDFEHYDGLIGEDSFEILVGGENQYCADSSAEFITDNDCYLVWFKYEWQWPLKNYFASYEVRSLKKGDAVMFVEKDCKPRNVIISLKVESGLYIGETFNDLVEFASYGTEWKMCPPSAGALDYPLKNAAWSEAVFRMWEEFKIDATEIPELTYELYQNLNECDVFIDSEVASNVATETAEDFAKRNRDILSMEQKEKLVPRLRLN